MNRNIVKVILGLLFIGGLFFMFPADIATAGATLAVILMALLSMFLKRVRRREQVVGEILTQYSEVIRRSQTDKNQNNKASAPAQEKSARHPPDTRVSARGDSTNGDREKDDIILALSNKSKPQDKTKPSAEGGDPAVSAQANPYVKKTSVKPVPQATAASAKINIPVNPASAGKPAASSPAAKKTVSASAGPSAPSTTAKPPVPVFDDELSRIEADRTLSGGFTPPPAKEMLSDEDLRTDPEELREQASMTLEKSLAAYELKDYQDCVDTISSWQDFNGADSRETDEYPRIIFLKAKAEHMLGQHDRSIKSWQQYFTDVSGTMPEADILTKYREVTELHASPEKRNHLLPILFMLLDLYRKSGNYKEMDNIYTQIASTYETRGDSTNLLSVYQNQLSIKKRLKNYEGQLHLLDMMGKLYYDQGDKKSSRICYQESIKIRREMLESSEPEQVPQKNPPV